MIYQFKMDEFMKSMPHDNLQYMAMLQQTQGLSLFHIARFNLISVGFNEFIHERETKRSDDPTVKLFDEVIISKKNRARTSFFHKSRVDYLTDTTDHLWRTAAANPPSSRFPGDYRSIITRSEQTPRLYLRLHLTGLQFPLN